MGNNLIFILWILLYPICCRLDSYIATKERYMLEEKRTKDSISYFIQLVQLIVYILIAIHLY